MATTTTPESFFSLPSELLTTLAQSFPCREPQIRTFATLVHPRAAPARNLIVHGPEATGKSAVTARLLAALHDQADPSAALDYAIIRSAECVTARHLFERTVAAVSDAVDWDGTPSGRCETLATLTVELGRILEGYGDNGNRRGEQEVLNRHDEDGEKNDTRRRFVLVFDGIDRQREAPPTLLPALARLSEIIPNLTTTFILTSPSSPPLRLPGGIGGVPTLHFAPYTKAQYLEIATYLVLKSSSSTTTSSSNNATPPPSLSLPNTTPQETADLWARFAAAVHDALIRTAGPRTLPALLNACRALWPRFTAPVAAGTHRAREFGRLLVAARVLFQDESVLQAGIGGIGLPSSAAAAAVHKQTPGSAPGTPNSKQNNGSGSGAAIARTGSATGGSGGARSVISAGADLAALLPQTPRLLLIAAYLASHNAPRHDLTLFSTWHHQRRRRRGGRSGGGGTASNRAGTKHQHRRIARKLLGPGAFVLERMVAIYVATRGEWGVDDDGDGSDGSNEGRGGGGAGGVDGDVGMAIATLASLRLLVRVGGGGGAGAGVGGAGAGGADLDRGGKWRVNVGWEVIRALGRSMNIEVEEWLID
ncbi:putative origin recognition complex subunit orc5 protein [Eutypa lata UCREL1]|uniref:Putative origin recognition complex subunit orc5 protein n=1 Tax=Eutypa lata (strain UCR-EL1) TaxID=1287681 RepID=M7TBJ3_EUTLA|nr:putative origin recognition complex subunit orc5 protein [Eutypa lata UCREL1]